MEKLAANGTPLDKLRGLTEQFYEYCGIVNERGERRQDTQNSPENTVYKDVQDFSNTLASSMAQYIDGDSGAVDTFKEALKLRSSLLTDPKVNEQTRDFLRGVVHIAENGNPEESLKLTKDLHANALDSRYKGEAPKPLSQSADGQELYI